MQGGAEAKAPGAHASERLTGKRAFAAAIAGLGWFGLGVEFYYDIEDAFAGNLSVPGNVILYLSYFTNETNLLIALALTIICVRPQSEQFLTRPHVNSALVVYIIVVGVIYAALLRNLWQPHGMQLIADHVLHDAMPLLYCAYWLMFLAKGGLRWIDPVWWLIYPTLYFFYVMVRGAAAGAYPYPFINAAQLGFGRVFLNATALLAIFFVLGAVLTAVDHALSAGNARKAGLAAQPNSDK
jgi:hypothetical protein